MAGVSDDYVTGYRPGRRESNHVLSLKANPTMGPGQVGTALCGVRVLATNFAGCFLAWHVGEEVCAACKAAHVRPIHP